jgi:hypothetical protein
MRTNDDKAERIICAISILCRVFTKLTGFLPSSFAFLFERNPHAFLANAVLTSGVKELQSTYKD